MSKIEFLNASGLNFKDISSETYRVYTFPSGTKVRIEGGTHLNVSSSGGHRIFCEESGLCHYIPSGWIQLTWEVKPGSHHFDF